MMHPYADPGYAAAMAGGARVVHVAEWNVPVLLCPIPGSTRFDARGVSPLTPFAHDGDLAGGLARLRAEGAVSFVAVADPMSGPGRDALAQVFPVCRDFKIHYIVDPTIGSPAFARRHQRSIARATRAYEICVYDFRDRAAESADLFRAQLARHGGSAADGNAEAQIAALAMLPGTRVFGALRVGQLAAFVAFVSGRDVAYSHIAGTDEAARADGAHHACYAAGLAHFADRPVDLGGVPGLTDDPAHGLALFKAGFANRRAMAFLCGAILDPDAYAEFAAAHGESGDYFPAYRAPAGHHPAT